MSELQNEQNQNDSTDKLFEIEEETQEIEAVELDQSTMIETLTEDLNNLEQELDETRAKADEYLEGWQRALAEFSNYKKRVERDQSQVYQMAAGNIIKRYLDVLDDLDRALRNRPQDDDGLAWSNGIELIYRKLLSILESEGVKPMEAQGKTFDPNLHEAITSEDNGQYESGQIIEVVQQGYLLGDRVLRPALVRVAR